MTLEEMWPIISQRKTSLKCGLTSKENDKHRRTKAFNKDPKVADYRDGEEVLELMMGD